MVKGSKHSEDAKRIMSEAKKGKHYSPKTEFKKGQNKGSKNPAKRMGARAIHRKVL